MMLQTKLSNTRKARGSVERRPAGLLSDDTSGATQRGVMWHLVLWHRVFVVNVGVQASTLPW